RQHRRTPLRLHRAGRLEPLQHDGAQGIELGGPAHHREYRGVETNHFSLWHDKAGNAVNQPLAGVIDPVTGLKFPDLNAHDGEATQTNLILPEPTQFIRKDLPACSVVRPTLDRNAGAVATIKSFTADKLFE